MLAPYILMVSVFGAQPELAPASLGDGMGGTSPDRVRAATPREAVDRLAQFVVGARIPVDIGARAFSGLPRPASGIDFIARQMTIDEVAYRLRVVVEARARGRLLARRNYVFPWAVTETVLVPRRLISAGSPILSEDLKSVQIAVNDAFDRYATARAQLVGRIAHGTLLPDRPIPQRLIGLPNAVKRGTPVVVQVLLGGMKVTMHGEAMGDAAVGDTVKVLNPQSNQVLAGRVVDLGLVEVSQ